MRALVKTKAVPGLELLDVPKPSAGPGQVVVRVLATSLCGTDNHIYRWDEWAQGRIHPPRIIGHELCGEVVEAGSGVAAVAVGDYVAAESHIMCAVCFQCRTGNAHVCKNYRILGIDEDGSYAEYVRLPERVLWKTSREIPPEFACLQEPLGNAVHAALVEDLTGQSVLITGCGPTGLFATAVARTAGAGVIIASDVSDYRLGLAKQLGADYTVNPTRDDTDLITRVTGGEGVDVALEMSGNPAAIPWTNSPKGSTWWQKASAARWSLGHRCRTTRSNRSSSNSSRRSGRRGCIRPSASCWARRGAASASRRGQPSTFAPIITWAWPTIRRS